jgi:hypothetical protein
MALRFPDSSEAAILGRLLWPLLPIEVQQCGFSQLVWYRWVAGCVGELLFADYSGALLVLQALHRSNSSAKGAAKRRSRLLANALREMYPGVRVFAALWFPLDSCTWEWVPGMQAPTAAAASSSSSSSSSNGGSSWDWVNSNAAMLATQPELHIDIPTDPQLLQQLDIWYTQHVWRHVKHHDKLCAAVKRTLQAQYVEEHVGGPRYLIGCIWVQRALLSSIDGPERRLEAMLFANCSGELLVVTVQVNKGVFTTSQLQDGPLAAALRSRWVQSLEPAMNCLTSRADMSSSSSSSHHRLSSSIAVPLCSSSSNGNCQPSNGSSYDGSSEGSSSDSSSIEGGSSDSGSSEGSSGSSSSKALPPPQPEWPGGRIPTDRQLLQQLHEACNARARWFIERGQPNESEAAAVAMLLRVAQCEMPCGFGYLVGYEWRSQKSPRHGDMLFTDGNGRLLVVEAKGGSSTGAVRRARQQGEALAAVLRSKYPGRAVFAAVWCPQQLGRAWEWVPGHKPPEVLSKFRTARSSSSTSSSSTRGEGGSSNSEAPAAKQPELAADAFGDVTDSQLLQHFHAVWEARTLMHACHRARTT